MSIAQKQELLHRRKYERGKTEDYANSGKI